MCIRDSLRSVRVLVLLFSGSLAATTPAPVKEFQIGQEFKIECQTDDSSKSWGPGPVCDETGKEISFHYGQDTFFYCGLRVRDQQHFEWLGSLVLQERNWNCRAPLSPERKFFLPFSIPLWGVLEKDHIHVDNHFNFIFHGDAGRILGAAAYPLRDRFQYSKVNSVINLHGPVRWFQRHSFLPMSNVKAGSLPHPSGGEHSRKEVFRWCTLSIMLTLMASGLLYQCLFKPALKQRYRKKE
eukprot:TRINITY_DN6753_c0_g1_i2.p1 TRINITY_DN6753_c0_g1~~TRINITY_DN6753_c0_g1_i2.p1  ORF type:complete len:240 (+),score=45.48 TRINITY_DN6753_c0_g1_i2:141-860(+)